MTDIPRRKFLAGSLAIGSLAFINTSYAESGAWPILNEWNFNEFEKYSQWVNNLYKKRKGSRLNVLLGDDNANILNKNDFLGMGNPQISKEELEIMNAVTHCGSFPELLFLYYSYRRGLPAIVSKIDMEKGGDIRYSYGNHPVGSVDSVSFSGNFGKFILSTLEGGDKGYNFVSGNYRTAPTLEGTDSVPVVLDRQFLRPGTMCYNANGHCLVVGDIEDSGEIHFLDAHPDHSITFHQTLSAIPFVSRAKLGINGLKFCYDGFRNPRLAKIIDGKAVHFSNEQMISFGYSVEQYKKMAEIHDKESVDLRGEKISSYPDLVRVCLKTGIENPLKFLETSVIEFKNMLEERESFIQQSWNDVLVNGPITLPDLSEKENIYQANGRWETWSSPSSDIDRKNKYNYISRRLENMIDGFGISQAYDYNNFGSKKEMIEKIIEKKKELFSSEKITYKTSSAGDVTLTLEEIEKRLFDLSFDPNHDPALRWGAPKNSIERENMKLFSTPLRSGRVLPALEAYELEGGLRYYPIRQTTPTSLNPKENPKTPGFKLFNEIIGKMVE